MYDDSVGNNTMEFDESRYPVQYVYPWTMPGGLQVVFRPVRFDDEARLASFHATLSENTVYLRYLTPIDLSRRVDHERLFRICHSDYEREFVLVVERRYPATLARAIIAVGRLSREHALDKTCEFALVISDGHQGRGLGTELLRRLLIVASDWRTQKVLAYMLHENVAMQQICDRFGFKTTYDAAEGLLRAELDLHKSRQLGA